MRICMNDHHHLAFIYISNYISLHSNLVHMVIIRKIAYVRSWKSKRESMEYLWILVSQVHWEAICSLLCITEIVAAFMCTRECNMVTAPSWIWASKERQWFFDMSATLFGSNLLAVIHDQHIGSLYRQNRQRQGNSHNLDMCVNKAWTIYGFKSKLIGKRFACCYP